MTKTGEFVRAHRELLSMSQEELGIKIGVSGQFISNIERGICLPPRLKISPLSRALKLSHKTLVRNLMIDFREKFINAE